MKDFLYALLLLVLTGCGPKTFTVVQIADAQLGFTAAELSQTTGAEYVNDLTYEAGCLRRAVEMVNELRPDVVVFTGDQVNYADNTEQWDTFAEIIRDIDGSIKVLHLPGNHDVRFGSGSVDSSPFTERYRDDHFVYSVQGVNLIGINTNLIKSDDPDEAAQFEWLRSTLHGTAPSDVTLIFGHHPFFMTDIDEDDSYFPLQKSKRRTYFELFTETGVDAVYAGHRHNNSQGVYNGIPMTTTTSVGFQIGEASPSVRVISVMDGELSDELIGII